MHSFAHKAGSFFENRKLEIKENYNSYNEIKRHWMTDDWVIG